jgi:bifunctional non-homologous end joining protein LigD
MFSVRYSYRALAFKDGEETRLVSRNQKEFTKYPELNEALKSLPAERLVIDGEIAALDPKGRSSFQLLQGYETGEQRPPLVFYVFDLFFLEGKDLRRLPLVERRSQLEGLLKKAPENIRFSAELRGTKEDLKS